jgi:TolB-like protein/Flp pilus assembly protein TadD
MADSLADVASYVAWKGFLAAFSLAPFDIKRARMEGRTPSQASTPAGTVFLSYALQDGGAARKICEALRAGGIEVWFDQSELRGGDAWDRSIRKQIKTCALFLPVISANAHSRIEGYFRLEWKLAVDRSDLIAPDQPFLLPVVIDGTLPETDERIPDRFRELQWTSLPDGETPPEFVERVRRLLSAEAPTTIRAPASATQVGPEHSAPLPSEAPHKVEVHASAAAQQMTSEPRDSLWARIRHGRGASILIALLAVAGSVLWYVSRHERSAAPAPGNASPATASQTAFNPPAHSIAVLPFINLSGPEQDYFSDGLTEELLNSLAAIKGLQVAARNSAFSFKGNEKDLGAIARKLNVGAILEGSVRRSGRTIRVSAQLINPLTGFHLWSKTYDRDLGDVLKLQAEIASAVAQALKVTLLGDISEKIEPGGTHNPAAFDAYLRASEAYRSRHEDRDIPTAIATYTEAIRLDPNYALAYAGRATALTDYTAAVSTGAAIREGFEKAEADARRAIALAPELAEAHMALAFVSEQGSHDFAQAREQYEQALALAPGNSEVLRESGSFGALMGNFDTAIAALRRAVVLDPLDRSTHLALGRALYLARRYPEAAAAFGEVISLDPVFKTAYGEKGLALYGLGDLQSARAACESQRDDWESKNCLAMVYDKLGRRADASTELAKIQAYWGDAAPYQYAEIYAQWGDRAKALASLETAMRLRDAGLVYLKTDPLLDPLRNEPRFQAIERALKFPE